MKRQGIAQGGNTMIIVMKPEHTKEDVLNIINKLEDFGLRSHLSEGEQRTIIGAIGDERQLQEVPFQ